MDQKILDSKRAMRRKLAALPMGEKFRIMDELNARLRAIKGLPPGGWSINFTVSNGR